MALSVAPPMLAHRSSFPPPAHQHRRSPSSASSASSASSSSASSSRSTASSSSYHSAPSCFTQPFRSPPLASSSAVDPLEAYGPHAAASSASSSASAASVSAPPSPRVPQQPRFSRLPFLVAQAIHDTPSAARLFFAVRRGRVPGVYADWRDAERQVADTPDGLCKAFSTRWAAHAFVLGWEGGGRHSLPPSSPRLLREYLAMEYGAAMPLSRPRTYHARLAIEPVRPSFSPVLPNASASSAVLDAPFLDFTPAPRPAPVRASTSYRHSMVRISSPLRQEVGGAPDEYARPDRPKFARAATSIYGLGGLLTPPQSPQSALKPVPGLGATPPADKRKSASPPPLVRPPAKGRAASEPDTEPRGLGISSATATAEKRKTITRSPSSPGLWADAAAAAPPVAASTKRASIAGEAPSGFEANASAPKFSRSALRKSGVVMPVAAPRQPSASSSLAPALRKRASQPTLSALSSQSSLSLSSTSSDTSASPAPLPSFKRSSSSFSLPFRRADRAAMPSHTSLPSLFSLSEGEPGAGPDLAPPRPAFLRSPSQSSLSSTASSQSIASATSATSLTSVSSARTDVVPIAEECLSLDHAAHGYKALAAASGLALSVKPVVLDKYEHEHAFARPPAATAQFDRTPPARSAARNRGRESDERSREGSCEGSVEDDAKARKKGGVFRRFTKALKSKK
ncbi:hypothetical protein Q5752_006152 [Cryptotrichosporon argae]